MTAKLGRCFAASGGRASVSANTTGGALTLELRDISERAPSSQIGEAPEGVGPNCLAENPKQSKAKQSPLAHRQQEPQAERSLAGAPHRARRSRMDQTGLASNKKYA